MILTRRTMFAGMAAAIAAPAIIRTPGLIMPIKPVQGYIWMDGDAGRTWRVLGMCGQRQDLGELIWQGYSI